MLQLFRTRFPGALIVFFGAVLVRMLMFHPVITPDSKAYIRIAENLTQNVCYSYSDPISGDCVPTWSNQPPGYPFFIALVKMMSGSNPGHIVIAQSLLYAAAVAYLFYSLGPLFKGFTFLRLMAGILLSLSPLTTGWSQWVLTECLATASVIWVLAECARSLDAKQLRIVPLGAALITSVLLRWDLAFLVILAGAVACGIYNFRRALSKIALLSGLMMLPLLIFTLRAMAVGLPLFPPYLNPGDEELPPGILRFWKVAAIKQTAASAFLWNIWNRHYQAIGSSFDFSSVAAVADTASLRSSILKLSSIPDGESIPKPIDQEFASIAQEVVGAHHGFYRLMILGQRCFYLWELKDRLMRSGWVRDLETYMRFYRLFLLVCLIVAVFIFPGGSPPNVLSVGILIFTVSRTVFLAAMTALEIRYLTPGFPLMELVAALLIQSVVRPSFSHSTGS